MKSAVRLVCLLLSCCLLLSILPTAARMEVTDELCETCGQSPCICTPEEEPTPCPDCDENPCTCTPEEEPTPCPECGETPCICTPEEEPPLCPDCGQEECICEKTENVCLGADICVDGIHTPDCPCYVAPSCTQDENCTLTENHLEGCPKTQSVPAPISELGTELVVKMFMLGPNAGEPETVDRTKTLVNEVGIGLNLAITLDDKLVSFDTLSLSESGVVSMNLLTDMEGNGIGVMFTALKAGTTQLIYTDPTTQATETVVTFQTNAMSEDNYLYASADENTEDRTLWSFPGGGFDAEIKIPHNNVTLTTTFGILKIDGFHPVDPNKLYTTTKLIQLSPSGSTCGITLSEGANGLVCYDDESGTTYTLSARDLDLPNDDVGLVTAPELILVTEDNVQHESFTLYPNESINVTFRKGSSSASIPFTGTITSSDPDVLEVTQNANGYTLTAKAAGNAALTGTNGENKTNTLQIDVPSVKIGAEKLFNALGTDPNGNSMRTYLRMTPNEVMTTKFLFGTSYSASEEVTNLEYSGNVTLKAKENGYYEVTAGGTEGNGLIWYNYEGVDYTIPVRVAGVDNGDDFGDGNTIQIGDVIYGTAIMTQEKMTFCNNFGDGYLSDATSGFSQQIVLAAMSGGNVAKDAYSCISDVRFEMLTCVQESNNNPCSNATLSSTISRLKDPASGVLTWGTTVSAEAKKGFMATVAMSFTLSQSGEALRRITLQCHVHYTAVDGDVVVYANDLDTVGKLNAVLSSRDALVKYLKNPGTDAIVEGNVELCEKGTAGILMYLPKVTYEGIVVAQTVPDAYEEDKILLADGKLRLSGVSGTIFRGLIHRGGLGLLENISFVANPDVTMTYGNETFTCGILSDYTLTDIPVTYDQAYLNKYCGGSTPNLQDSIDLVNSQSSRLIGCVDLHLLYNCSFTGFDYGVYATENGMVGGGKSCSFTNCYTGIYVDARGDNVNSRNVDYSGYTFRNNVYAVRVASLTDGITPYSFRVHDCNFYDNYREFWITPKGDYYCYRNYYGGYWQDQGQCANYVLNKNCTPTFDDWDTEYRTSQHTGSRPGRYYSESGDAARVITTASRSTPDGNGGYWIYGRKDQNNRILQSEGSSLLIAEDSIDALTQDTDVYIVNNDGSEIAVITFQGTED